MEDKGLDKLFRAEKENEGLVPPASVWEGLENDLRQSKRKKRVFVWWILGLLLLLTSAYFFYPVKEASKDEFSENSISISSENNNSTLENHLDHSSENGTNIDAHQNDTSEKDVLKTEEYLEKEGSSDSQTIKKSISKLENNSHSNIPTAATLKKKNTNSNPDLNFNKSTHDKITLSTPQTSKPSDSEHKNVNDINPLEILENEIPTHFPIDKNVKISPIRNLSFLLVSPQEIFRKPNINHIDPQPNKKDKLNRNTITAFIQFGRPNFTSILLDNEYNSTESNWYSFGLGLNYQYEISNSLHLGGGVSFRQSKKKFNYESEELSLIGYESGSNSGPFPFEYGKRISQGEQKFSLIDLSTSIKYDILSGRMKVSVGLSALVNLKLITEGKALDSNSSIMRYSIADKAYQSSLGFGISPSLSFSFPFNDNTFLTLTPNFTTYFQNLESDLLVRDIEYSNFGMDIGVSRKF